METRVTKWGNDLALRIPKSLANQLGLELNSLVRMSLRGDALVIAPVPPIRLKLDDLLDQVTAQNLHGEVDTGPAVGQEAE
ncbi:MAG: AbrB/MazE/SpoVT family DNA-binding domain-containing protein [Caldilineaceae bacterium SB0668_bin_21]|nr:AbrB/MazE/SpoVT family DNA-binding domain-containing protein [Caldilineaceae bacterium SB0668_bin_21]MYC20204.1 AbrB/MazE/SpoVT family DNA-binding domain-containing protein [Caldilineaceae bacterium SB0662_bin_25]